MRSFALVTAAPPTPNGDLHLGHLAGPYSGADVYIRSRRLLGDDGLFVTGSDVHQSYVPVKARRAGAEPLDMARDFADEIARIFASARFDTDAYVRPYASDLHRGIVRDFFARLYERGKLEARSADGLFCATCDRYLFEAHVTGKCPACGATSDGNSCENCALPNVCTDLVDAVCNGCGATPRLRRYRQLYFPLGAYAERLREFHATAVLSPQLEALCARMLADGLPDIPVSHPTDWGIEMPAPGFEDQRIYVWAEMVPGYFAGLAEALRATGRDPRDWREVWNDPATDLTQFFGFDNGYFHAVLHPALLMAYDPSMRLPSALLTNEFYQLEDSKFSTSRRHAIWANDLLAAVPADTARYVLAHDRPETWRTSFTWDRFGELVDGELVGTWQRWLTDLFQRLDTYADGVVPELPGTPARSHQRFLELVGRIADQCLDAYTAGGFSPRRATRLLGDLVRSSYDFARGQARSYDTEPGTALAALAAEAAAAGALARLAYPVMPEFAGRLWTALGGRGTPRWDGFRPLAAGQRVDTRARFFSPLPADLERTVMRASSAPGR